MPNQRMRQINSALRDYFATALMRLVELPAGVVVSVTRAQTTSDLHNCTIFLSVVPDDKTGTTLQLIRQHSADIIAEVADRITFRSVPKFRFVVDDTERKAASIDRLLDIVKQSE